LTDREPTTQQARSTRALAAAHWCAICALIALIFLSVLWEGMLAPIRPGGSLLTLKAVPLLFPLFGLLRERVIAYKWTLLLALPYFAEGVVRAYSDTGLPRQLAFGAIALSVALFVACALYVRLPRAHAMDSGAS
jgi:uncharacterized membrane protein